jgi:hypothetical protein
MGPRRRASDVLGGLTVPGFEVLLVFRTFEIEVVAAVLEVVVLSTAASGSKPSAVGSVPSGKQLPW